MLGKLIASQVCLVASIFQVTIYASDSECSNYSFELTKNRLIIPELGRTPSSSRHYGHPIGLLLARRFAKDENKQGRNEITV
jgi:hypothetical protein